MKIAYREAISTDLQALKDLAIASWSRFKPQLEKEHWESLYASLTNDDTYLPLLNNSYAVVGMAENKQVIGMTFLVPHGNPTDIYDANWCYIRFVTVHPSFAGQGIGRHLTQLCLEKAKQNKEQTIALHTSELMNNARHIYESLGFNILKELDKRLGVRYWLYTLNLKY
jgi:ribosomal protein S18 acetylase RimI-like enzyme